MAEEAHSFSETGVRRIVDVVRRVEAGQINTVGDRNRKVTLILAEIVDLASSSGLGEYEAKQVHYDPDSTGMFSTVTNGYTWGEDSADFGTLKEVNLDDTAAIGNVYPVFLVYEDDGGPQWMFEITGAGSVDITDFKGSVAGSTLSVNSGDVQIGDTVALVASASYDLTARDVWVEVTCSLDSSYQYTYAINTTLQDGADIGDRWEVDSTGDLIWKILVLRYDSGGLDQAWEGGMAWDDFSPGHENAASSTLAYDIIQEVTNAVANELSFGKSTRTLTTVKGLVTANTTVAIPSDKVTTDGIWLGIPAGTKHLEHGVSGLSQHWTILRWITDTAGACSMTQDGAPVSDIAMHVDVTGHLRKVVTSITGTGDSSGVSSSGENGEAPGGAQVLKFEDCDTGALYFIADDVVLRTLNKVYELLLSPSSATLQVCVYYRGKVAHAIDTVADTLGTTAYDTCLECEGATTRESFTRCDLVLPAVVLEGDDVPLSDYVWIKPGNTTTDEYHTYSGGDTTTDPADSPVPCVVDPASTEVPASTRVTPVTCYDCTPKAFGDNWTALVINLCKWLKDAGTWAIVSNRASSTPADGVTSNLDNLVPDIPGPFIMIGRLHSADFPAGSVTNANQVSVYIHFTSGNSIAFGFYNDSTHFPTDGFGYFIARTGQATVYVDAIDFTDVTWTVDRQGSTVFITLAGWFWTYTESTDVDRVLFQVIRPAGDPAFTGAHGVFILDGVAPECIPATDGFTTAPDSLDIDDEYWTKRWTASGTGTPSLPSNQLLMAATGGNDVFLLNAADIPTPVAGDVVIIMDVAGISMTPPAPTVKSPAGNIVLAFTNGDAVLIQYQWKPAPTSQKQFNILTYYSAVVNTVYAEDATATGSNNWFGELKIVVSDAGSGNIDIDFYRDGVFKWNESSKALTSDTITIRSQNSEAGGTMDVTVNDFTLTANGSPVNIC